MNRHLRKFKDIAHQVFRRHNVKRGPYDTLRDFLMEDWPASASVADIAVKALRQFCVESGDYNAFEAGVLVVVQFLRESCGTPPTGAELHQCLVDLRSILIKGGKEDAIRSWITGYFS